MKHNIPYIKKSLVTILTNPPSPYHLVHEYYHPLANKLQNLPQYGVNMHSFGDNYLTFHTHNRFQHSLDVALLLERIAHNLQLPGNITNFLIIAWLLHDIAIPMGGDPVKARFPEFDEEENFIKYMEHYPKIRQYLKKNYNITLSALHACIKNEGIYWILLDITDRIAYTLRDIWDLSGTNSKEVLNFLAREIPYKEAEYWNLYQLMIDYPLLGEVIDDVAIDYETEKVYFKNPQRLLTFLTARALMSNIVYFNPEFQAQEYSMGLCIDYLLRKEFFTKEDLLLGMLKLNTKPFGEVEVPFSNLYGGINAVSPLSDMNTHFRVHAFSTAEERSQNTELFRSQLPEYENLLFYKDIPPIKSGSYYNVLSKGKILPLREALSGDRKLEKLEALSRSTENYLLFYPREEYMKKQGTHAEFFEFLKEASRESVGG